MKGGFSKGPVSPAHNKKGNNGGGGVNTGRALRTSIPNSNRGGFEHSGHRVATSHGTSGHGMLPGGHKSTEIAHGGGKGGGSADRRIRAHFAGVHHGGHEGIRGKSHAGKGFKNHGAHRAHGSHPHNLPSLPTGFGKGPVGLDD